jgi:carboxymethylenebutenolidase
MATITLTTADGHSLAAYEAAPVGAARGGVVVVQEIFGVNPHIREVADGFAADGYHVIAPAIFDRAERGTELGYSPPERDSGRALAKSISTEDMLADIDAAAAVLRPGGRVAVVGFCLGGSLAWLAATRLDGLAAAVGYYGGMISAARTEKPRCPVMLHFGEEDPSIPDADVAKVKDAVDASLVEVFTYAGAGHAFSRTGSDAHHPASARLARQRTLAFLRERVG